MSDNVRTDCPECAGDFDLPIPEVKLAVDRRNFIRVVGGTTAAVAVAGATGMSVLAPATARAVAPPARKPKPAEDLIRELFSNLSAAQKARVVKPFSNSARLGMYNQPLGGLRIDRVYNAAQTELIERIVKSISSGEDGYRRLSRGGRWDNSGALNSCGAMIFGNPVSGEKFSWVFTGHHLTVRCDGNSEEGAAFGGPMYYGHSPNGYSRANIFYYQTRSVQGLYKALNGAQQRKATVAGSPGELEPSIRFRKRAEDRPGIRAQDLTQDQRTLVEQVMRDVLSPYRTEDVDEVMTIVRQNGGLEKIHIAFYPDRRMNDSEPWHFWRLEGPGFVWNYRVLPHVHTYVNISSKI